MAKNKRTVLIALFSGFLVGAVSTALYFSIMQDRKVLELDCQKQYPLTSHSLDCAEFHDSVEITEHLHDMLEKMSDGYIRQGKATRVSVWTRDLISRQWAAYEEFETYAPASLFKVPLMIAYFKFAQISPNILNEKLIYEISAEGNSTEHFRAKGRLETGKEYSVIQLIEEMITNSDNNSAEMLVNHIDPNFFNSVLLELGIRIPKNMELYDFVTVKTYGNVYRVLYNASYLNREYSEKALTLLGKSSFKGMADPLPSHVKVAHKFGEREIGNMSDAVVTKELHDCGIVYKNGGAYSLCIFTEGRDFEQLLAIIKEVSKTVYENR